MSELRLWVWTRQAVPPPSAALTYCHCPKLRMYIRKPICLRTLHTSACDCTFGSHFPCKSRLSTLCLWFWPLLTVVFVCITNGCRCGCGMSRHVRRLVTLLNRRVLAGVAKMHEIFEQTNDFTLARETFSVWRGEWRLRLTLQEAMNEGRPQDEEAHCRGALRRTIQYSFTLWRAARV